MYRCDFEEFDATDVDDNAPYFIRLQGAMKYCIINRATGDVVKGGIPNKKLANAELDDYMKALAA